MAADLDQDGFTVSVLIVNWNARDDLRQCLRSVAEQTEPPLEVVLVDNGSSDGSAEMVRQEFPAVQLLEPGRNLGFADGCNQGLRACSGSWVAVLNNDATADPGWLAELHAAALSWGPRLGSLQSRILFRQKPGHTNSTGIVLYRNGRAADRDFDRPARQTDTIEEIFCPTAAAALYRRAMLEEVKGSTGHFDSSFFMYMEDVDLGWRCRLAGWESIYVPGSIVHHAFQASSSRHGGNFVELQCRKNRLHTLAKNASLTMLARCLPLSLADLLLIGEQGGAELLREVLAGVVEAGRERRRAAGRLRVDRRELERRWLQPSPRAPR